ncbi:hypothetical protein FNV43_RR14211 [Rhamnella rubrinervis]|uniref:Cystinosin homolog n=1 Tax=Rhamnella rubrinervis TaxID=2594499 RepID=A0A8K0H2M2_9ROSA|nr:hypothetical protein FNV43_RR14211 [Rhamnella rubrinervis]
MASWNSIPLEITQRVLGWIAFASWGVGFYPQVILNFRRKSVVGLNFDYMVLSFIKHSSYLIYNASLYLSSDVQEQYFQKYGFREMIPVALNDVAFSTHAVILTAFTLFQIAIYQRGDQTVSKISIVVVTAACLTSGVCFFIALPTHSWLWLISVFNTIQVFVTLIKAIPQAFMNFMRKSTDGFSIGMIFCDFTGGVANFAQMAVQSIDQDSWVNFYGNIGKTMISLISIAFDLLFMCQRFLLYPANRALISPKTIEESKEPLIIKSCEYTQLENPSESGTVAVGNGSTRTATTNGIVEFDSAGNHMPSFWLDCFFLLGVLLVVLETGVPLTWLNTNLNLSLPSNPTVHVSAGNSTRGQSEVEKVNEFHLPLQQLGGSGTVAVGIGSTRTVITNGIMEFDSTGNHVPSVCVVGLNFDFVVLNFIKQSFYLIYNATLYFSSDVQKQYFDKYGYTEMIPVAFNDVAFSTHSVLLQAFTLYQIAIYERGAQTVSRITIIIVTVVLLTAGACFFISLPTHSWLWLISIFNSIQIIMTLIKYIPQAFMNFARKSTNGFSISMALFDFSGGVANFAQMAVQSIDQDSWVNFYGNIGKTMISLICIFFDLVFMCQRFLLYPAERVVIPPKRVKESKEPLITKSSDDPQLDTVRPRNPTVHVSAGNSTRGQSEVEKVSEVGKNGAYRMKIPLRQPSGSGTVAVGIGSTRSMIPVAFNDVAFSSHAVLLVVFTLCQIATYEHGAQTVSRITIVIVTVVLLTAGACFFIALPTHSWLWLISIFNYSLKCIVNLHLVSESLTSLFLTHSNQNSLQYDKAFMNFIRKSTDGFSIGMALFGFSGGVANFAQMTVQSIDQGSLETAVLCFPSGLNTNLNLSRRSHPTVHVSAGNSTRGQSEVEKVSSDVQKQYFDKYGYTEMIPVAFNDVAFSSHAVLLSVFTLYQIATYEHGAQTVSRITIKIVTVVSLTAGACFFIALPTHSWLWLISIFKLELPPPSNFSISSVEIWAFMNFIRKSTDGFSIGNSLFGLSGGVTNFAQMAVQSIDQDSWVNFYGNIGKTMISLICIFFDLVFLCQRCLLYPAERVLIPPKRVEESQEPLIIKSSDHPQLETM